MQKKKLFIVFGIFSIAIVGIALPKESYAQTADALQQQIADLQKTVQSLQQSLTQAQTVESAPVATEVKDQSNVLSGIPAGFVFEKRLEIGDANLDVKYLQIVLNSHVDTRLASTGPGSPGNETTKFGGLTKQAVIKFQEKYADEILAPWGLQKGTGSVGTTTRKKLNQLHGSLQTAVSTTSSVSIEVLTPTRDFVGIEKWYAGVPSTFTFEKRLELGDTSLDVKYLQIMLNSYGDTSVASAGPGSLGKETTKFGGLTKQAVIKFQEKYADEILAPWGLQQGTGSVGTTTRKVLNLLLTSNRPFPPNEAEQGDTVVVRVAADKAPTGAFQSEHIGFIQSSDPKKWIGIVGIDISESPGTYPFTVTFADGSKEQKDIVVREKIFPRTVLQVSDELEEKGYSAGNISTTIREQENVTFNNVFKKYTSNAYFNEEFMLPLDDIYIVGGYGNIRKSGSVALHHLGYDLDAAVGTSVYAVNNGVVRYTKESTNYGKAILIDHGLGIYSAYLHLSEFKVAEGEQVTKGDVIGLSGNTGYSIEPHLHFSIRTHEGSVDPLRFIDAANKALCTGACSERILTFGLKVLVP